MRHAEHALHNLKALCAWGGRGGTRGRGEAGHVGLRWRLCGFGAAGATHGRVGHILGVPAAGRNLAVLDLVDSEHAQLTVAVLAGQRGRG